MPSDTNNSHRGSFASNKFMLFSIFFISFLVLWLRRPDILINAQFWAEDGEFWFKDAIEIGPIKSLFIPANGYFQSVSRIIIGASTLVPYELSPLISNIFGLSIRASLVWFLFTSRFSFIDLIPKVLISLYFLLMPGLWEVHANITNTHWYLALYLLMILISKKPETNLWKSHDYLVCIISSLSGPFVVFIAFATLMKYLMTNVINKAPKASNIFIYYSSPFNLIIVACTIIQASCILLSPEGARYTAPLGASLITLSNIISSRVVLEAFAPYYVYKFMWDMPLISIFVTVLSLAIISVSAVKLGWRGLVALSLPVLLLGFALAKPMLTDQGYQWLSLSTPITGERYFVIPHIILFSIVTIAIYKTKFVKDHAFIVTSLYCILFAGLAYAYFSIAPLPDYNWKHYAEQLENNKSNHPIVIPINPAGWEIKIP